jgi:hypothetical protein
VPEEVDLGRKEQCDFIPFSLPKAVHLSPEGRIDALELLRTERVGDGSEYRTDQGTRDRERGRKERLMLVVVQSGRLCSSATM